MTATLAWSRLSILTLEEKMQNKTISVLTLAAIASFSATGFAWSAPGVAARLTYPADASQVSCIETYGSMIRPKAPSSSCPARNAAHDGDGYSVLFPVPIDAIGLWDFAAASPACTGPLCARTPVCRVRIADVNGNMQYGGLSLLVGRTNLGRLTVAANSTAHIMCGMPSTISGEGYAGVSGFYWGLITPP